MPKRTLQEIKDKLVTAAKHQCKGGGCHDGIHVGGGTFANTPQFWAGVDAEAQRQFDAPENQ